MTVRCMQAANAILGEGPVWLAAADELLWIDIHRPAIFRFSDEAGQKSAYHLPFRVGCISPTSGGELIVADAQGFALFDPRPGLLRRVETGITLTGRWRFNDGKVDRAGRFWAGTINDETYEPNGCLYRLDRDLRAHVMVTGLTCSNGIGWSPDNRTMYLVDSMIGTIWAYEFDLASGDLGTRRIFAKLADAEGIPDGLTVDERGGVWVALWDGWRIAHFSPDGTRNDDVSMPVQRPTSCMFGGSDLSTLYVTSASIDLPHDGLVAGPLAGALFAVDTQTRGLPEPVFSLA